MKKSNFQTIILVVFGIFVAIGIALFATFSASGGDDATLSGDVTIWGDTPFNDMSQYLTGITKDNDDLNVKYVRKNPETFQEELEQNYRVNADVSPSLHPQSATSPQGYINVKLTR